MKKIAYKILAGIAVAFAIAWWFRYDTHCHTNSYGTCVAYDRFTGRWIFPSIEAQDYYDAKGQ